MAHSSDLTYNERLPSPSPLSEQGIDIDNTLPLVERVLRSKTSSFHQKQLSADSTSPRIKYNFNSNPNLRPKLTVATTRSSPGTPNLSSANRRRKPPPPPASYNHDDDDDVEIKTIARYKSVESSPSKSSASSDLETLEPFPIPMPRRKRRTLKSHQTRSLNSSPLPPNESFTNIDVTKPRLRRTPPLPPKNVASKEETDHNSTIGMQNVSHDVNTKTSKLVTGSKMNGQLKSLQDRVEPVVYNKVNVTKNYSTSKDDIKSPPSTTTRPPGLLFTPPPSRSQSLRKYASKHNRFFSQDFSVTEPKSNTLTPALTKPLPPLPSTLSKPLPPLPIEPSSVDSDYAYIPDYPDGPSPPSIDQKHKSVSHHYSNNTTESLGEYVRITNKNVGKRNPSQIGYTEDEYISMAGNSDTVDVDHLSDVFKEDSEYISMMPSSQSVSHRSDDLITKVKKVEKKEEEYIAMSSTGENSVRERLKTSTLPTPMNSSRQQLFDFNSMYIDLDMIRSEPSQHSDNEARHPKSRFSISSETFTSSIKEEKQYGNSSETKSSPKHVLSKPVPGPLPKIAENQIGIYATISDIH